MLASTRIRLLEAARDLLREGGVEAVTMVAVAREADVSRQAAYLHFTDRTQLLIALVDVIDREAGLDAAIAKIQAAPTGPAMIRAWAEMQVARNPRIAPLARALDAHRHTDEASASAWRDRHANRMTFARQIVDRLAAEGLLHASWSREHAAILVWELVSFRVWDDLVTEATLPRDAYVDIITSTALAALAVSPSKPARKPRKR